MVPILPRIQTYYLLEFGAGEGGHGEAADCPRRLGLTVGVVRLAPIPQVRVLRLRES